MQKIKTSYKKLFVIAFFMALMITTAIKAKSTYINYEKVRCTCYLPTGNPTASGVYPYEGVIASNRDHLGQTAALYT